MNKTKHLIIAATALTALTAANMASAVTTYYWDVVCHPVVFNKSPYPAGIVTEQLRFKQNFMNCKATPTSTFPADAPAGSQQGLGTVYMCPQSYKDVGKTTVTYANYPGYWLKGVNGEIKGKLHTQMKDLSAFGMLRANPLPAMGGGNTIYNAALNGDNRLNQINEYLGHNAGIIIQDSTGIGERFGTYTMMFVDNLEKNGSEEIDLGANYNWWGNGTMQIRNTPCQPWPDQVK